MATKNYTTKTASLKATKADVNKLETKKGTIDKLSSTTGTIGTLNSTTGDVNTLTVKTINGAAPIVKIMSGDSGYAGGRVQTNTLNNKTTVTISQKWTLSDTESISEAVIVKDGKAIMADGSMIDIDTNMIDCIENVGRNTDYTLAMQEWYGDMTSLTKTNAVSLTGSWFIECQMFTENLTTFVGDMPNLTTSLNLFRNCKNLTTFVGDLSSLTIGGDKKGATNSVGGMFENTNLSLESVEIIAESIHDFGESSTDKGLINISWFSLPTDEKLRNDLVDALNIIVEKGWHVETNSELKDIAQAKGYKISTGFDAGFFTGNGWHGYDSDF